MNEFEELNEETEEETPEEETPEKLEELHQLLIKIGEDFDLRDSDFRDRQVRELKKNLLFWDDAQRLFFSEADGNWINVNGLVTPSERRNYGVTGNNDRVINIYRPHGESIIAALSVGTPVVQFFPDDADNPNDISTGKAYSKIATLIHKHNNATLLYIKALFILYNQGLVAAYNYTHQDDKYGSYESEVVKDMPVVEGVDNPLTGKTDLIETIIPQIVGKTKNPKVRECIEVYGPLHVSVPSWCRKQEDITVLKLEFEQHVSTIRATYKEKFEDIRPNTGNKLDNVNGRLPGNLLDTTDLCTLTVRWFLPQAYASLGELATFEALLKKYPNGCKVVSLDKQILECIPENLNDHWTITTPIFSETIHQKPQGSSVIDIQEIRNDLINNLDEGFRQSIAETFADPDVLDFDNYGQTPKSPGQIFKAKPKSGKSLSDAFHTLKTATIPQDSDTILRRLDADAQFSSGAFPSIFGGQSTTGSKTASEYAQSRAQALQRLSTYWKMMSFFWAQLMGRATTAHARNLVELNYDERYVENNRGSFINVVIQRAELEGKIGNIEPEASDNFPISSSQKRDLILQMLQLKNPIIESVMAHPENSQVILESIGMPEIHLPGSDDRNKQLAEIYSLIKEQSPDNQHSTEPIDPDADDDGVHIQICKAWLVSDVGRFEKESNAPGYLNVVLHLREHLMNLQMKTMAPTETPAGQPPNTNATE